MRGLPLLVLRRGALAGMHKHHERPARTRDLGRPVRMTGRGAGELGYTIPGAPRKQPRKNRVCSSRTKLKREPRQRADAAGGLPKKKIYESFLIIQNSQDFRRMKVIRGRIRGPGRIGTELIKETRTAVCPAFNLYILRGLKERPRQSCSRK